MSAKPKWYMRADVAGYWFGLTAKGTPEFMIPRTMSAAAHVEQILAALNEHGASAHA